MTRRALNLVLAVAVPLAAAATWWIASAQSTNAFFPPLQLIFERFQALWLFDHFATDVLPSLRNLALGFLVSAVGGVLLGFVLATVPLMRALFEPVIHFVRGIPPVALIPILITLIGFGVEMRVTTIVIAAIFPTMIATMDGIRAVDPGMKDVCSAYRFSRGERLAAVYLPAAGPQIAAGMQVSLQVSFVVMIASEMLGSSDGIGAMTLLAQQSFMSADMWAGILLLGLVGFLANTLFEFGRARVLAWYIGSKRLERAA